MISPAPTYLDARIAASPRCPAPSTSTDDPRCTPPYCSAQRLVAGDHGQAPGAHRALVLLHVAAADPARLHAQQRAVARRGNDGPGELSQLHLPGPSLDHGTDHVSHGADDI